MGRRFLSPEWYISSVWPVRKAHVSIRMVGVAKLGERIRILPTGTVTPTKRKWLVLRTKYVRPRLIERLNLEKRCHRAQKIIANGQQETNPRKYEKGDSPEGKANYHRLLLLNRALVDTCYHD
eukprot:scaffold1169_cov120-Cylindrotheca_fusiformis.AAC.36